MKKLIWILKNFPHGVIFGLLILSFLIDKNIWGDHSNLPLQWMAKAPEAITVKKERLNNTFTK